MPAKPNLTGQQEKELVSIAEHLIGTLAKDMSAEEADERVAEQVKRIYRFLGYEMQTFISDGPSNTKLHLMLGKGENGN